MATVSWGGAVSGNWATGSDWGGGSVPQAGDSVYIDVTGSPYTVTITAQIAAINSLTIGDPSATLDLIDPGVTQSITGSLSNSGIVEIDNTGAGGSVMSLGGNLINSGTLDIGNSSITASSTLVAAGLSNTGVINLAGGSSATAVLDITSAAPTTWTGTADLTGHALLEFAGGEINTIASTGSLVVGNAAAFVADAGTLGSDSALTGLSDVAGDFELQFGASLALSGGLVVSGRLALDDNNSSTGSVLTVAGDLTNSGQIVMGAVNVSGGQVGGDSLSVSGTLSNSGTIDIFDNAAAAMVVTVGSLVATSGQINLIGDRFGGGGGAAELIVSGGASVSANLSIGSDSLLDVTGIFDETGGTTTVVGTLSAAGVDITGGRIVFDSTLGASLPITLGGAGIVEFGTTVASGEVVTFGTGGELVLDQPGGFSGAVAQFKNGETIDVKGIGLAASYSYAGGIIDLKNAGGTVIAALSLSTPLPSPHFVLASDGSGGTLLQIQNPNTFSGSYPGGIVLSNPSYQNPATITASAFVGTGTLATDPTIGVLGTAGFAWTVTNYGHVEGKYEGVYLTAGGTLANRAGGVIEGGLFGVEVRGAAGTVTNYGTIEAPGGSDGVYLAAGGSVTNQASGVIEAGIDGVLVTGATGTVTNYGTIRNTDVGVFLESGTSTLVNGASGSSGGFIEVSLFGVEITGAAGIVINYGTVEATGAASAAVYLKAGGSVVNRASGLIESSIFGVEVTGAAGTITNYGTIEATAATGFGIHLTGGGSVTNAAAGLIEGGSGIGYALGYAAVINQGTIEGTYGDGIDFAAGATVSNAASALISGAVTGIFIQRGTLDTVTNLGTIEGTTGFGVNLAGDGTISNAASGLIEGGNGVGYAAAYAAVINQGTIRGTSGDGIIFVHGASISNAAPALISGYQVGIFIEGSSGTVNNLGTVESATSTGIDLAAGGTVIDSGAISGATAIYFGGTGSNLLVLDPGYSLVGAVVASGSAHNTLELGSAAATGTLAGTLGTSGFGADLAAVIVDTGAAWLLSAGTNALAATTTLSNFGTLEDPGTLVLGGSFANSGTLDIESGARLDLVHGGSGAGTIAFYGSADLLQIGSAGAPASLSGAIAGFAQGDTIDMAGLAANGYSYAGGVLTLKDNGTVVADLTLSTNVGSPSFTLAGDGSGGTDVSLVSQSGTVVGSNQYYGIVLSVPSTQNPATIAAGVYVTNRRGGDAVFGDPGFAWTVANEGTINITASIGADGIYLADGGLVTNRGTIEAYVNGIEIHSAAGTVVNYGTIENLGIAGEGVILLAGGTVTNKTAGLISGSYDGVYAMGQTVVNYGKIQGTGTSGVGIKLGAGGSVVNQTGASIAGYDNGVSIENAAGTVVNYGTVRTTNPTFGDAVNLYDGGSVANKAGGTISGYYGAVHIYAAAGTVVNYGSIVTTGTGFDRTVYLSHGGSVTNEAGGFIDGYSGIVVYYAAGTLVNYGTVAGSLGRGAYFEYGSVANMVGGTISGYTLGVGFAHDAAGTVVNSGMIIATGSTAGAGVSLGDGGFVSNSQSGVITGAVGVDFANAAGTLVNRGTISSTTPGLYFGAGAYLSAGGAVDNFGTIEGVGSDNGGVLVGIYASSATITNEATGLIEGNHGVGVNAGSATLVNYGRIDATQYAGVRLTQGGFVSNAAGGTITGSSAGVEFDTVAGSLVNSGTILATGTGSAGVDLAAGGIVTNQAGGTISGGGDGVTGAAGAATVVNNSIISGFYYGVELSGAAASVANYGTIENAIASGAAVRLVAGGTIDNQGLISGYTGIYLDTAASVMNGSSGSAAGTITGETGVVMNGSAGGSLVNYGTIAGTIGTSGYATGVVLAAGDAMTNFGVVTAAGTKGVGVSLAGGNLTNRPTGGSAALISGGHYAVYLGGGGGMVTNYGTIAGGVDAIISRASIVAISNFGVIEGTGGYGGIYLWEGEVTNNAGGTILGGGVAVDIARYTGTVVNSGTITGTGGVGVYFGASYSTLVNAGTIIGNGGTAVSFLGSGNRLIDDPGAVFTGIVYGGAGNDTLELASAAGTGTLTGLGTSFTGFQNVVVDAGAVWKVSDPFILSPPAFTNDGTIIVSAGTLDFGAVGEDLGDKGVIDIGQNGLALFDNTVAAGQTISFTGTSAQADLADASGFLGSVTNFRAGDTLDFAGIVADGTNYAGGILTLTDNGTVVADITLATNQGSPVFVLSSDGSSGTDVTLLPGHANIFGGTYHYGIVLNDAATENPATITAAGSVTNAGGSVAVLGTGGYFWTLTNFGHVGGTGIGVDLTAGGEVVNGTPDPAPGYIEGSVDGVKITGGIGTVANYGTIIGLTGHGVYLGDGGRVVNGTSANAAAYIRGYAAGVLISNAAGTVVNYGTIESNATGAAGGAAVVLADGGSVANFGLIESANFSGVAIKGTLGTVTNLGTLASNAALYRSGVYLDAGGLVVNGMSGSGAGLIEADWVGVGIAGGGTLVNYGTVDSFGTQAGTSGNTGLAVFMPQGGDVINRGLIEATGFTAIYIGGSAGVPNPGARGTVTNFGIVESYDRTAIALASGGTVANYGLIDSVARTGVYITGAGGAVTNRGTVEGNGQFYHSGVDLAAGGIVTNGAGGSGAALIEAAWIGVDLAAGGSVVNYGTIDSFGTQSGSLGFRGLGVFMPKGGSVINEAGALIEATDFTAVYAGGDRGVGTSGATGTVVNLGTVLSSQRTGIDLAEGGLVVNGSGSTTGALVEGGRVGIYIGGSNGTLNAGAAGTLFNYGTIESTTALHSAIVMAAGGIVSNEASGEILGGLNGISTVGSAGSGGAGTIANYGAIEGAAGSGVYFGDGGVVTNEVTIGGATNGVLLSGGNNASVINGGIIEGNIAVLVSASDTAANKIINDATIIGSGGTALQFAGGTDTLVIDPSAVFVGDVVGDGALSTLELAAGGGTGTLALGSTFTGFDNIKVDAGAVWQISDARSSPPILTNDGTVDISGHLVLGNVGQDKRAHGTIDLTAGATAVFDGSVAAHQKFIFTANTGTLRLENPDAFAGKIFGFKAHDLIDVVESQANGFSFAASFADHRLTVSYFGVTIASLKLAGKFKTSDFTLTADGRGGVYVSLGAPSPAALAGASHFFGGGHGGEGGGQHAAGAPAFEPFGGAAGSLYAASLPAADNSLSYNNADPFHFWTLQN